MTLLENLIAEKYALTAAIKVKIAAADALVKAILSGTAPADADAQIEILSDEAEVLSDKLAEVRADLEPSRRRPADGALAGMTIPGGKVHRVRR